MSRINLTVYHDSNGPLLIADRTPSASNSSVTMTLDEYRTFRWYLFHIFRVMTHGSSSGLQFGKLVRIDDTLKTVLYFLYVDIAQLVAPRLSTYEQLEQTALALYSNNVTIPESYYQTRRINLEIWSILGRHFFDMSVSHKINSLLSVALNAGELETIKQIVEKTNPAHRGILLSTKGTASITHLQHLNIQRTGTALQLALYSGDEDIVAYLKTVMDPEEFENQSKEVFRNTLPPKKQVELDAHNAFALEYYNAMLIVQKVVVGLSSPRDVHLSAVILILQLIFVLLFRLVLVLILS